jgi:hypothetical protein
MKAKQRLKYKPPEAIDLSAFSIGSGNAGPEGTCANGTTPYQACSQGPVPSTTCNPGTTPGGTPECPLGPGPGGPTCNPLGSRAIAICFAGSLQA